jgi:hypothetical protein
LGHIAPDQVARGARVIFRATPFAAEIGRWVDGLRLGRADRRLNGQPTGMVDGINTLPDFLRPPLD